MSWETELSAGRGVIVDRSSPIPIYFQVATQLQKLIESDVIPVGTRFENEVDLAERLGVSRPTMRRAMQYLVERGMVVRKRGVGTQVVHPKVRRTIELSSLYDDLAKSGRAPSTVVRSFTIAPASLGVAAELGITEGDDVSHFERVRYADGEPLAIMTNSIPCSVVKLDRESLEKHGLYNLLRAGRQRTADRHAGHRCPGRHRRRRPDLARAPRRCATDDDTHRVRCDGSGCRLRDARVPRGSLRVRAHAVG